MPTQFRAKIQGRPSTQLPQPVHPEGVLLGIPRLAADVHHSTQDSIVRKRLSSTNTWGLRAPKNGLPLGQDSLSALHPAVLEEQWKPRMHHSGKVETQYIQN